MSSWRKVLSWDVQVPGAVHYDAYLPGHASAWGTPCKIARRVEKEGRRLYSIEDPKEITCAECQILFKHEKEWDRVMLPH